MSTSTSSIRPCKHLLVTGGAGFMGSAFVRKALEKPIDTLVTLDLLTYAGNRNNLGAALEDPRHTFVQGDICNAPLVDELIRKHKIDTIVHFAAESHVDRSIANPSLFYKTNVEGTLSLLEVVKGFQPLHFHHISTDEVYGSIESGQCTEESPYRPNSPYAASKAASDHLVRAYAKTYGISTTVSHSVNNFGPHQFEEKFVPVMIRNSLEKKKLPIYGTGQNVRDWLFVDDHAEAVWTILERGMRGEAYNIGGGNRLSNLELLNKLLGAVSSWRKENLSFYESLITFVPDRPGHDFRYALSAEKLGALGWKARFSFEAGLEETVRWYASV